MEIPKDMLETAQENYRAGLGITKPRKELPLLDTERWAHDIMANLIRFELVRSTTPEKQEALNKISDHRIALSEIFDIVCPGWGEGDLH